MARLNNCFELWCRNSNCEVLEWTSGSERLLPNEEALNFFKLSILGQLTSLENVIFCGVNQQLGIKGLSDRRLHVKNITRVEVFVLRRLRWRLSVSQLRRSERSSTWDVFSGCYYVHHLRDNVWVSTRRISSCSCTIYTHPKNWTKVMNCRALSFSGVLSRIGWSTYCIWMPSFMCLQLKLWSCHSRNLTTTLRLPSIRKRCAWTTHLEVPES